MPVQTAIDHQFGDVRVHRLAWAVGSSAEAAVQAWLAGEIGSTGMTRDGHGRPDLDHAQFDCNWSHSGPWLLVALGDGVRVGIDVERIRPRPRALELAQRFFHPDEAAALASLEPAHRERAFLELWCAKEAVLKAHGRGLVFGLDRLRFDGIGEAPRIAMLDPALGPADAWRLDMLALDGAIAAVASRRDGS